MSALGNNRRNSLRRVIVSLMVGVFVATIGGLGALAQTPPPEDVCAGALTVIPGAAGVATSNIEATSFPDDPDLSCTMGPGFGSVFFTFVATETSARVRTDLNSVGLDSDFSVYAVNQGDQCNTSLWNEVGCNEDGVFLFNGETCIEGLTVGDTYKIMLKSFTTASSGDYTLQIDSPCDGSGGGGEPPPEDTEDPVVTAPDDIIRNTDAGLPTAVVDFLDATATDNVIIATLIQTAGPASGSAFPIGTTVVTWTATDAAGNSASDSTNITVTDNEDPVFSPVLADIVAEATSAAGAVVTFPFATATDNSGGVIVTQIAGPASGSQFPIGATEVTFEAVDLSGNTAQGSFTVTVVYIFGQFLPPLEDGKIYKANRTLPVKFQITYVGGEPAEEAIVGIEVHLIGGGGALGEPIDLSTFETADTGYVFRFTDGQYIFNLSTKGFDPGMYRISAILSNGQAPFIDIELR